MISLEDAYNFMYDFEASGLQIAAFATATGTGKSTKLPEGFYRKDKTVFIVQPTTAASMSVAGWVQTLIPKAAVGSAADSIINYKNSILYPQDTSITPLVYCTAGHLRNILLKFAEKGKSKAFVDYIFLDEAHQGDLDYDTILYIYNYLWKKNLELNKISKEQSKDKSGQMGQINLPKLVLITATPGVYPFKANEIFNAKFESPKIARNVEIIYHTKDYKNLKGKDAKDLFTDMTDIVIKEHIANPVDEFDWDAWLVFCPGKGEINSVVSKLREFTKGTIIIPLYSNMTDENAIQFNMIPPLGFRKIVVATNIAEASITIDDLSYVFDSLVEKITVEGNNGATMLILANISKTSAQQRKGRTGRTRDGRCYRMCTEEYFNTALSQLKKREIERIAPDIFILNLFSRNLDIEDIVTDGAIPIKTLKDSKKRLATIGLLNDTMTDVTVAGNWIKNTKLSPRSGMFFWLWTKYSEFNVYIGAVITAVMETQGNGGYFYIGEDRSDRSDRSEAERPTVDKIIRKNFPTLVNRFKNSESKTSFFFNISLILYIISVFRTIDISSGELAAFCKENNLNNANVKLCITTIKDLTKNSNKNGPIQIGDFDIDQELIKAESFLYQCFSDQTYIYGKSKRHKIKTEIDSFLGPKDQINDKMYIIPLSSFETDFRTFVSMYHTINQPSKYKISIERK